MAKKKQKSKGKQTVKPSAVESISSNSNTGPLTCVTPPIIPVFLKVCRLCENRDGPFLNIFDAEKVTAKKIDELMPFSITENDDLPHKICFRCSAKLEELYEFIQKCIKTQENLHSAMGRSSSPSLNKTKRTKMLWEEKLNKTNMSNDDICDALIKKAMEGIKALPSVPNETINEPVQAPAIDEVLSESKRVTRSQELAPKKVKAEPPAEDADVSLKQVKLLFEDEAKPDSKGTKSDVKSKKSESSEPKKSEPKSRKQVSQKNKLSLDSEVDKQPEQQTLNNTIHNFSFDYEKPPTPVNKVSNVIEEPKQPEKPFNIMDYISMIKVNDVGVLFQCNLCNRNFLKKDVVESHNCHKNGVRKVNTAPSVPVPEPPKVPTVKYIKIDNNMKKTLTEKVKAQSMSENDKSKIETNVAPEHISEPPSKPKPRAGPASKTRRKIEHENSTTESTSQPEASTPTQPPIPSVNFPAMPNLNGRFKLVPGPNNIFTLVEDVDAALSHQTALGTQNEKKGNKRKSDGVVVGKEANSNEVREKSSSPEVIDLEDQTKPYPVGLFQTAHNAGITYPPITEAPPTFTTPAMKKQSYTIVQTGNPSKLLISTKPRVETEIPKKKTKKSKSDSPADSEGKEPFRVTLEDVAPPKDTGFFTFINVDPLLQPSYVLPTDNIIQESQISTSSSVVPHASDSKDKDKYSCNMCGESFTREKKLLSHIQSHYTKMDEEDEARSGKPSRKKGKKK